MNQPTEGLQYPLSEVKKVITKWLYLEDSSMIDVMLATYLANYLGTDPTWMLFVAPPSHAKTEALMALNGHPKARLISLLTPSTLVSGMRTRKGQPEPSLLLKLDGKIVILKDFTSVLSMRSEAQQEILGQLREVYDGQYSKEFGTGKRIDWCGHVGLIGAVTPVYDKHYSVIGALGDRFLLYRTHATNGRLTGKRAQQIVGREDEMRSDMKEAVHAFLAQFDELPDLQFEQNEEIGDLIVDLAGFVALCRLPVERDRYTKTVLYLPLPEGTPRLVKQLMQLGMGLCLVHGKPRMAFEEYDILRKVGRDLIPSQRLRIIQHLWEAGALTTVWRQTKEIAESVNLPTSTVKVCLEDLMVVGALDRNVEKGGETAPYNWRLSPACFELIQGSRVFDTNGTPF